MRTGWRRTAAAAVWLLFAASSWSAAAEPASPSPPGEPVDREAPAKGEEKTPDFEEMPDRWNIKPPPYELNAQGEWWDPYNQNLLKGDYPILGQDVFFKLTGISKTSVEGRSAPTASGASAARPGSFEFFGKPNGLQLDQKWGARLELQKGSTSFKPFDWQFVALGVVDLNYLSVGENGVVSPDVVDGTTRLTSQAALQEAAIEVHLADLSENYDFLSTKIGRQPFNADFRSLLFRDVNQGARLFGSADGNRYQYNLIYFYQAEKDIVSELNTFDLRHQQVAVANVFIQDLLFLGWQNEFSLTWDYDNGVKDGYTYDQLGFLARPDPVGAATPHNVNVFYLGWNSDGHIGPVNITHAFYEAVGNDTLNPIAGRQVDINAQMAFLELSLDRDWMRYETSVFFSSGDGDPRDGQATAFDSVLDDPQIMGGDFGYWNRQSLRLTDRGGVGLMQRKSVIPDLRSSKFLGQANFVNPGILMANVGAAAELTPTLRLIGNAIYLRFNETESLEVLLKQPNIRNDIGIDLSLGLEYRPLLNNNVIVRGFGAILQPLAGFRDIYQSQTLFQVGTEIVLVF